MKTKPTPKKHAPWLVNAEHMAAHHPDTFTVPSGRANLQPGDFAKVCAHGERFWVEITKAKHGVYVGTVANILVVPENAGMAFGHVIEFGPCNVFAVLRYNDPVDN